MIPPPKSLTVQLLTHAALIPLYRGFARHSAQVVMMHRFADPNTGNGSDSPALLRQNLEFLRAHRFEILSVGELVERLAAGEPVHRCVAFTIDDGYADAFAIAAPIFAAYDCPATVFIASGFVDRTDWFWWDKFDYLFSHSSKTTSLIQVDEGRFIADLSTESDVASAMARVHSWGRTTTKKHVMRVLAEVSSVLGVEIPRNPPRPFEPLSWDDCRRLGAYGITFGPHTTSHPNLAAASDEEAAREIESSWERLTAELDKPVPVLAYPYGDRRSFTRRDVETCKRLGLIAAFASEHGAVTPEYFRDDQSRFALPRIAYEASPSEFRQSVSGLEQAKKRVRAFLSTGIPRIPLIPVPDGIRSHRGE